METVYIAILSISALVNIWKSIQSHKRKKTIKKVLAVANDITSDSDIIALKDSLQRLTNNKTRKGFPYAN